MQNPTKDLKPSCFLIFLTALFAWFWLTGAGLAIREGDISGSVVLIFIGGLTLGVAAGLWQKYWETNDTTVDEEE